MQKHICKLHEGFDVKRQLAYMLNTIHLCFANKIIIFLILICILGNVNGIDELLQ